MCSDSLPIFPIILYENALKLFWAARILILKFEQNTHCRKDLDISEWNAFHCFSSPNCCKCSQLIKDFDPLFDVRIKP
jgi:hypothetical protein